MAWEALEDAGLPAAKSSQTKTGVYVGVIGSDYALLQSQDLTDMDVFSGTGSSHAILANRLSYVLNLNGPSIALGHGLLFVAGDGALGLPESAAAGDRPGAGRRREPDSRPGDDDRR